MKMTDEEKGLLERYRKLESLKSRNDVIFQIDAMVRAQEAIKADYGLLGPDATLFNGTGPMGGGKPAA